MQEIAQIVRAYKAASKLGKKTALATVVHVYGSSYRRPGARMLVTEDGEITGAISGGCLEGDALRKAALAINQEKNKLVIYDTTDEDDAKLGIQLGCNGIVSILFEPILESTGNNPIHALERAIAKRQPALIITAYSQEHQKHLGTFSELSLTNSLRELLLEDLLSVLALEKSLHTEFIQDNYRQECFIEYCAPCISLVVVGAGNDAIPLVKMASILGWDISLVDGRHTHANQKRFPGLDNIFVGKPVDVLSKLAIDARTAFILMTHNYNYDLEVLQYLLGKGLGYIGLLGPASKRERMFDELLKKFVVFSEQDTVKVFGPTGLDVGAEKSEEIALSICAEIMSVINHKSGFSLRKKSEPIHQA